MGSLRRTRGKVVGLGWWLRWDIDNLAQVGCSMLFFSKSAQLLAERSLRTCVPVNMQLHLLSESESQVGYRDVEQFSCSVVWIHLPVHKCAPGLRSPSDSWVGPAGLVRIISGRTHGGLQYKTRQRSLFPRWVLWLAYGAHSEFVSLG